MYLGVAPFLQSLGTFRESHSRSPNRSAFPIPLGGGCVLVVCFEKWNVSRSTCVWWGKSFKNQNMIARPSFMWWGNSRNKVKIGPLSACHLVSTVNKTPLLNCTADGSWARNGLSCVPNFSISKPILFDTPSYTLPLAWNHLETY